MVVLTRAQIVTCSKVEDYPDFAVWVVKRVGDNQLELGASPLWGQERTSGGWLGMSASCQDHSIIADTGQLPAFSLRSKSNCLCSIPNMVDQAPNTTVTRSAVYEIVTMYIPQREPWMRAMPPTMPRR